MKTVFVNNEFTFSKHHGPELSFPKFMILHQNICGLLNKLDMLEVTLKDFQNDYQNIDVLCFSETFVQRGCESNIILNNFKLASSYCRENNRGGTAILVRKSLEIKSVEIMSKLASDYYFECCGTEITSINLIIITIYRIPQQTQSHLAYFLHKLENLCEYLALKYKKKRIVVCGDWNIDTLKENLVTKDLVSILRSHNIAMHIKTPTRINTCIDHIASNVRGVKSECHKLCLSDHDMAQSDPLKTYVNT
jgi:exonuclease III